MRLEEIFLISLRSPSGNKRWFKINYAKERSRWPRSSGSPFSLQRTKLDYLQRSRIHAHPLTLFHPTKRPFTKTTTRALCDIVTTNRFAATLNHTVHLMSPFTEHYAIRLWSAPSTLRLRLQFDSLTGYSVCTNRCNIRCGYGSFLSMVTSHLLAVPNTESTNCYNLWLAWLRHLQPLARHSLSSYLGLCLHHWCNLRLRFFGFAISSFQLWFFPAPARQLLRAASLGSGSSRFRIPWS